MRRKRHDLSHGDLRLGPLENEDPIGLEDTEALAEATGQGHLPSIMQPAVFESHVGAVPGAAQMGRVEGDQRKRGVWEGQGCEIGHHIGADIDPPAAGPAGCVG
jgi:hypothetical protein